jgi:hypothetical protein
MTGKAENLEAAVKHIWVAISESTRRSSALLKRVIALENIEASKDHALDSVDLWNEIGSMASRMRALKLEVEGLRANVTHADCGPCKYDFMAETLLIHAGAYVILAGVDFGRCEVWCHNCGRMLGFGSTLLKAWEAASQVGGNLPCVVVKPHSCNSSAECDVRTKHPGAEVFSNLRERDGLPTWTVRCSICGQELGSGLSERGAWSAAAFNSAYCVGSGVNALRVDSDFRIIGRSSTSVGSTAVRVKNSVGHELCISGNALCSAGAWADLGKKFHVTITEVPE